MRRHFPYRKIVAALMLLAASVSLMNITGKPDDGLSFWESLLSKAAQPLYSVYYAMQLRYRDMSLTFQEKKDLLLENERLKQELEALRALQARYDELLHENRRLSDLLGVKEAASGPHKTAKVIGREPSKWLATLTIDLGSADGVRSGDCVISAGGLVGRILKVGETTATVLLLTDPESGVGAIIQRSRDYGLVLGGNGSETLILRLFSKDASVEEGDMVLTSGMGSKYPPGIVIGQVESVYMSSTGLIKEAVIRPASDLNHLEEVLVVLKP